MAGFAQRTGLTSPVSAPSRYLWTDAFAVCNYLELHRQTANTAYLKNALNLVDQVHNNLGRQRVNHPSSGWISGLSDSNGSQHPTQGGLRIGKTLDQRGPGEPFDERLEWERDGQYFHYLTKWMHALNRVATVTGDLRYNLWAIELAKAAHAGFTYTPQDGGPKRMYWKMSIDLTYPLVTSMGQHDPLDGLITYKQLQATAMVHSQSADVPNLDAEIVDMEVMCEGKRWSTDDALGIGGLLAEACRLAQLITDLDPRESRRLIGLLDDVEASLDSFIGNFDYPADYRLAFRELGLAIGIHAIAKMREMERRLARFSLWSELNAILSRLGGFLPLSASIESFWMQPMNQRSRSWVEHLDINSVMLATSLAPDGYLALK